MQSQAGEFEKELAGPTNAPKRPDEILALVAGGDEIRPDDDPWHLVTAPVMVQLAGGGFVVIWCDKVAADGSETIIEARLYSTDGAALGPAFRVNTTLHSGTPHLSAAATQDGGFVVTWVDDSEGVEPPFGYTDPSNILARAFGPTGAALGPEITVNSGTTGLQDDCQVFGLPGGGFAVTWNDYSADADREDPWEPAVSDIRIQLYDADRSPLGASFLVNTVTEGGQYDPEITALADGTLVVIWTDNSRVGEDTSGYGVKGRLLSADGQPLGDEFLVNTTTADLQWQPEVTALAGGGFVVTWINGQISSTREVRAQVFETDGSRVGGEINVNTATAGYQQVADTVALAHGGFVVVWQDRSKGVGGAAGDTSEDAIKAQVFNSHGDPVGGEILVNTATEGYQQSPRVAVLANGGFVVTWSDMSGEMTRAGEDTEFNAVKGQVFSGSGDRIGDEFRVNVTTAGDQSGPQVIGRTDGGFTVTWADSSTGSYQPMLRSFELSGDVVNGTSGDDVLAGTSLDDTLEGLAGNDIIDGGDGRDTLAVGGHPSQYRLLVDGDGFILKGPDGRDTLTGIEVIRFGDGSMLELDRLDSRGVPPGPGPDGAIPDHLLSPPTHDEPLVLPSLPDSSGIDDAFILPALPVDQTLVLPGPETAKDAGQPLVLPGEAETTPLFLALEARLDLARDGLHLLDLDGGLPVEPAPRHDDWLG